MAQELPTDLGLAADDRARDISTHPLFSLPAIIGAYVVAGSIAILLVLSIAGHSTALIQPIDPNFHAAMIGLGVFVGVVLAAVITVGRTLGIGVGGGSPLRQLMATVFLPLLIVALCGYAGSYAAERIVEWNGFHGLTPAVVDRDFTVVGKQHGKSGYGLKLQLAGGDYSFSLGCGGSIYWAVDVGDHLVLPVEIGRGGIGRTQLPASLAALRRQ